MLTTASGKTVKYIYTIGIEHDGKPSDIWTEAMKQASAMIIHEICQRWQIPVGRP